MARSQAPALFPAPPPLRVVPTEPWLVQVVPRGRGRGDPAAPSAQTVGGVGAEAEGVLPVGPAAPEGRGAATGSIRLLKMR